MNDSNVESLLKAILYGDPKYVVEPQSRVEALLLAIYESGGGGGGGGGGDDTYTRAQIDAKIAACVPKVRKIATATLDKDISAAELASMLELSTTYVDRKNVTSNKTDVTSSGSKIPDAKAVYGFVGDATSKAVKFSACVYGANYNDFAETGFYEALGNSTNQTQNAPDGKNNDNNYYVITNERDDQYTRQVAYSARVAGIIYTRVKTDNVWRAWERIATDTVLNDYSKKTSVSSGENSTTSVINVTDAKAQMAMVAKISGKTYKINNLFNIDNITQKSSNVTVDVTNKTITFVGGTGTDTYAASSSQPSIKDHIYYFCCDVTATGVTAGTIYVDGFPQASTTFNVKTGRISLRYTSYSNAVKLILDDREPIVGGNAVMKNIMWLDLTASFGSGKEPSKDELDRAIGSTYLEYGKPELWNAPVESVVSRGRNFFSRNIINPELSYTLESDGSISWSNTYKPLINYKFKEKTSYTITLDTRTGGGGNGRVSIEYTDGSEDSSSLMNTTATFVTKRVITPASKTISRILTTYGSSGVTYVKNVCMIEGSDTTFYPYNKTTVLVPSSVKNLPDYGCSVCDFVNEIDFENGVYYHNATKKKGSELTVREAVAATGTYYVEISGVERIIASDYEFVNLSVTDNATASSLLGNKQCTYRHGTNDRIYFKNTSKTSLAAFKEDFVNTEIVYNLSGTAKETKPISDFIRPLPVENGGTLTLVNEHNLDINSTIKYKKEV